MNLHQATLKAVLRNPKLARYFWEIPAAQRAAVERAAVLRVAPTELLKETLLGRLLRWCKRGKPEEAPEIDREGALYLGYRSWLAHVLWSETRHGQTDWAAVVRKLRGTWTSPTSEYAPESHIWKAEAVLLEEAARKAQGRPPLYDLGSWDASTIALGDTSQVETACALARQGVPLERAAEIVRGDR